jgi:hypothetical protein
LEGRPCPRLRGIARRAPRAGVPCGRLRHLIGSDPNRWGDQALSDDPHPAAPVSKLNGGQATRVRRLADAETWHPVDLGIEPGVVVSEEAYLRTNDAGWCLCDSCVVLRPRACLLDPLDHLRP